MSRAAEKPLRNAIDAAQAVMDDASATQAEVDAAAEALAKVPADLRKIPSKEELLELLSELEQLDLTKYTASSAAVMQAQINLLRATVEDATQPVRSMQRSTTAPRKRRKTRAGRPNTSNNNGFRQHVCQHRQRIWRSGCCIRSAGRDEPAGVCGFRHDGELHVEERQRILLQDDGGQRQQPDAELHSRQRRYC